MEQQEQLPTGKYAPETDKLDFSNNKETSKHFRVQGSPFEMVWNEGDGYRLRLGNYAVTEATEDMDELYKKAASQDWGMIVAVVGAIVESIIKIKEIEKEVVEKTK